MANATQAQFLLRFSENIVDRLVKPSVKADAISAAIDDADAEMALFDLTLWTTAQKVACSVAIARRNLYKRYPEEQVPEWVFKDESKWRGYLRRYSGIKTAVAFDPTRNETDAELTRLLQGD